jgi:proteasome alpha subunit
MAYDRGITVFSPDGRLFQVEYAREAVKKGATTIGLKFKNGVILIVDKRVTHPVVEPRSIEKIHTIDTNIGCATSGLTADARILVDQARKDAQVHKVTYGENISVEGLVKKICDFKQNYTQYGGVRPFGTALLMAGVDELGAHLFETDPSGTLIAYRAVCIGTGRSVVMETFEKDFKDNMTYNDAVLLGIRAMKAAIDSGLTAQNIEVGVVDGDRKFRRLTESELEGLIKKL